MNWLQKISQDISGGNEGSSSDDLCSGNCGMYAIALGKKAQEVGKKVIMIVCSEEATSDDFMYGEPNVYHIAVEIDGILYDGSGETTLQRLGEFAAETYGDNRPLCSFFALDDTFIRFVRTQTNWSTSWEEYYNEL